MFNFSANNLQWISTKKSERYFLHILVDADTKRSYRLYDFKKAMVFENGLQYCVSGKVNSADRVYLVVEKMKIKKNI